MPSVSRILPLWGPVNHARFCRRLQGNPAPLVEKFIGRPAPHTGRSHLPQIPTSRTNHENTQQQIGNHVRENAIPDTLGLEKHPGDHPEPHDG